MKKITKKDIRKIKWGDHDKLMECVSFLVDSFEDDKFSNGYVSALQDMNVRSQLLAERIVKECCTNLKRSALTTDELAKVIEEYFKEALKQE